MSIDPFHAYRAATEPTDADTDALVAAVESRLDRAVLRPWLLAVGVVLAAMLLWLLRPPSTRDQALRSQIEAHLSGQGWEIVHQGQGRLVQRGREVSVDWERGRLVVEVEPEASLRFLVHTPEAVVEVVGTGFVVIRDAAGTGVEVTHGTVRTSCEGGPIELTAGGSRRCWPSTAAGQLERARTLRAGGAPVDEILEAIERGRSLHPSPAVAAELGALSVDVVYDAGRWDEVIARGEPWLEAQGPRRHEVAERVALARLRLSGCASALALLRRLDAERGEPIDRERLARCEGRPGR